MEALELGGILVLAMGLIEVIKLLIGKVGNGKKNKEKEDGFGELQRYQLQNLDTSQKTTSEILNSIVISQADHTKILENILSKLD